MASLLKIDVSPRGDHSYSRRIGKAFLESWQAAHSGTVVERDLAKDQPTYVDLQWIVGAFSKPDEQTEAHKAALKLSDEIVAELQAADHILITTPMYNFQIPAVLKAWIDHAVRAGITFRYSESGPQGLLSGKKVTVVVASAGSYGEGAFAPFDHLTPYLRFILGFIGLTDVTFVHAGGGADVRYGKISEEDYLKPALEQAKQAAQA